LFPEPAGFAPNSFAVKVLSIVGPDPFNQLLPTLRVQRGPVFDGLYDPLPSCRRIFQQSLGNVLRGPARLSMISHRNTPLKIQAEVLASSKTLRPDNLLEPLIL